MKFAVVSDIHGNLPALEAVLDDIRQAGAQATLNLGDIVSGPLWPAETAARLMALDLPTIRGNHERQLLDDVPERMGPSDAYARARLAPAQLDWLRGLPATRRWHDEVWCCHGTPDDDSSYFLDTVAGPGGLRAATRDEATARAGAALAGVAHGLILCGHSHVPRTLLLADGRLVVNPGSVGLQAYDDAHPWDHVVENGSPHARYALLARGPAGWKVELRAVPYDHESAARRAQAGGRGDWADALRSGFVGRREAEVVGPAAGTPHAGGRTTP